MEGCRTVAYTAVVLARVAAALWFQFNEHDTEASSQTETRGDTERDARPVALAHTNAWPSPGIAFQTWFKSNATLLGLMHLPKARRSQVGPPVGHHDRKQHVKAVVGAQCQGYKRLRRHGKETLRWCEACSSRHTRQVARQRSRPLCSVADTWYSKMPIAATTTSAVDTATAAWPEK